MDKAEMVGGTIKAPSLCFYCSNSHIMEPDVVCTCACHPVEELYDKLKAINAEVDWTIPHLYAVKKLLASQG